MALLFEHQSDPVQPSITISHDSLLHLLEHDHALVKDWRKIAQIVSGVRDFVTQCPKDYFSLITGQSPIQIINKVPFYFLEIADSFTHQRQPLEAVYRLVFDRQQFFRLEISNDPHQVDRRYQGYTTHWQRLSGYFNYDQVLGILRKQLVV